MRFVTYEYNGEQQPGLLLSDGVIPLSGPGLQFGSMNQLIDSMNNDLEKKLTALAVSQVNTLPLDSIKLLAPIPYPKRNVFCLGKNYEEHAREINATRISDSGIPEVPIYFTKLAAPAIAHGDPLVVSPHATVQVDYEVELAIIIGKEGSNIRIDEALEYVFGYTIINDVTARDLQVSHKQWFKGKSLDSFCPMGPCIVYRDEINTPVELDIQCRVNGELRQNSNTRNMIFDIPYIINDLSKGLTLKPGDIICTGTPSGVGMGFDPPRFLKNGDVVECYIQNIGSLTNQVRVE
ncbi:MAG: fumarylacetoacetate hydrolase family protein [Syntrophomonadaceae bacterium]